MDVCISLEHVPPELFLCRFLFPERVQDQLTEVREVDEAVPCNTYLLFVSICGSILKMNQILFRF